MRSIIHLFGLTAVILSALAYDGKICDDNSKWKTNGGKSCAWVRKKHAKRCKGWGRIGQRPRERGAQRACKSACGTCSCVDSQTWKFKSKRTRKNMSCEWIGKKKKRCEKIGRDGTLASSACQLSCNTCPIGTAEILMTLYHSTGGKSWTNKQNWGKPGIDYCDWFGIVCEENIIRIVLVDNNLSGSIPPKIGNLSDQLASLDLSKNKISGTLPSDIGRLTFATKLNILENNISGFIPSEIGRMEKLRIVHLRDNNLTGSIPSEIGLLKQATAINLSNNYISGTIPSEIGKLSSLNALILTENDITGTVPIEICDVNIKNVYLDDTLEKCA